MAMLGGGPRGSLNVVRDAIVVLGRSCLLVLVQSMECPCLFPQAMSHKHAWLLKGENCCVESRLRKIFDYQVTGQSLTYHKLYTMNHVVYLSSGH